MSELIKKAWKKVKSLGEKFEGHFSDFIEDSFRSMLLLATLITCLIFCAIKILKINEELDNYVKEYAYPDGPMDSVFVKDHLYMLKGDRISFSHKDSSHYRSIRRLGNGQYATVEEIKPFHLYTINPYILNGYPHFTIKSDTFLIDPLLLFEAREFWYIEHEHRAMYMRSYDHTQEYPDELMNEYWESHRFFLQIAPPNIVLNLGIKKMHTYNGLLSGDSDLSVRSPLN